MRNGKKLWSLLLALIMVVSLFGGISLVGAAGESVTITPDATYDGEALTMTATGVGENITVFDLASIGFGTGIEYCLWFDHDGTFSFDRDVTLTYQGSPKEELKGGTVYKIADGISGGSWSELYVSLDDGNMLMILDSDAPGNFASLAADTPLAELPATVSSGTPAKETKTEEPADGSVTITPDATYNDEYLTMTAVGVDENYTFFSYYISEYCFWFDHDGSFSFDKDVELYFQGTLSAELKAGEVYKIADGEYSECYVSLDDGTALCILDKDNPGNFASLAPDTPLSEFPGTLNGKPAEKKPAEKPAYPDPEGIVRSAKKNADGSITLAFTSDVHHVGGELNLQEWIDASGIDYIDSIGFCGDLGAASAATTDLYWGYVGEVMDYVDSEIAAGKIGSAVYTHGNHEWFPSSGGGYKTQFSKYPEVTGKIKRLGEAVRTEDYIIYCFGAGEGAANYSCHFTPEDAAALGEYLSTAPTDIPIFILTHYPLHTWIRGSSVRVTNYASDVIDVLNEHPNTVLLWGHNHTEYDDHYYEPKFAGDEIVIDASGTTRTISFSYLAAGCTSDEEYTGAKGGSAATMNKGLIVTIGADGGLNYKYATLDGKFMNIESPWLVRFRSVLSGNEVFDTQYVEDGSTAVAPQAPEVEGYQFTGWTTWLDGEEIVFDFTAPVTRNMLVTANYAKIIKPVEKPDAAACVTVTPDATVGGESLTMTAFGVDDLITVFDLASIGYGTGIEYGFWFDADGLVSFDRDVTLLYQGAPTDFTLKAGEFYSVAGFGECYVQLDDGNMLLLVEKEAPGNFASLPGDQPFSVFPGAAGPAAFTCVVSNQDLTVDGKKVDIDHYNINGNNYFKLRDLACILNGTANTFDVGYDTATRTISLTTGKAYTPIDGDMVIGVDNSATAQVSNQKITVNGEEVGLVAFNIGGANYFKLRDLVPYLGYEVGYDIPTRTSQIVTK